MSDADRILGRLEEHQRSAERRFDKLEAKVDKLMEFKWRVAGGAFVLSLVLTALVEAFHRS